MDPQPQSAAGSAQPPVAANPFSPTHGGQGQAQQAQVFDMTQMQLLMAQMVETAQAASQAAQAAVARPANTTAGFADANKILNRPNDFGSSSHDQDLAGWAEWSHSFRTWLVFAESEFEVDLGLVEDHLDGPVDLTMATPARVARSQRLYAILASLLRAKPKAILRQITDRNGLEVWRVLTNTYAPKSKFRGLALLNALMALPTFTKDRSLREQIHGLERVAHEYQRVTGRQPGEDVLLGTLVRCLPSAIKQHVQLQMSEASTYQSVRDYVLGYEVTTTSWSSAKMHQALGVLPAASSSDPQGATPMEIDALQRKGPKGGKGAKSGKDKAAKGRPSKGDKGAKGAKGGKAAEGRPSKGDKGGKGAKGGKPKGADKRDIQCYLCGKKGHYQSECWHNPKGRKGVQQVQGSDAASTVAPSTVGPSVSQAAGPSAATSSNAKNVNRVELGPVEIDMTGEDVQMHVADSPYAVRAVTTAGSSEQRCTGGHEAQGLMSFGDLVKVLALNPHGCPKLPNLQPVVQPVPEHAADITCVCHDMAQTDDDDAWTVCESFPLDLRDPAGREQLPDDASCPSVVESIEALSPADLPDDHDWVMHPPRCLLAVQRGLHQEEEAVDIEVVVDSGSDASCLPMSWASIGQYGGADGQWYRDAQGHRISGQETRTATIEIAGVKFREQWLLSSVTQPLFCVGKLMRKSGWDIIHDEGRVPHLTSPDGAVRVPLFYKNYSLHAKGFIRGVFGQESASEPAVRALEVTDFWLSLDDQFHEVAPLVYARRDYSDCFLDCCTPLAHLGVKYRTTIRQDSSGWDVVEFNQDVSLLEQPEAEFQPRRIYHMITIGSCNKVDLDVLFNRKPSATLPATDDADAEMRDDGLPELPHECDSDAFDQDEVLEAIDKIVDDEAAAAAAKQQSKQGHIVVDGVELHEGCNLKTIRAACEALKIGKSGGKATLLARIADHLDKQRLLEHHQVEHDPVASRLQPREQAPVAAPTPEQIRLHSLTHIPFQPWCEHCIKFQARSDKHTKARPETRECSVCAFDYCFTERPSGDKGQKLICLVAKDSHTGATVAIPTPAKGGSIAFRFLVAELCKFINFCGHSEVALRSDGEATCRALAQGVKDLRTKLKLVTHLEQTEKEDHQGNPAEQTVDQLRQLTGTLLSQVEEATGQQVATGSPLHAWCWRHASWLQTRYSRTGSASPFEVITGRPYAGKIVNFSEVVYARVKSTLKGKARWIKMMWLGKLSVSDLHFGVTKGGFLISSRSVRRLPQQYDASFLEILRDQPWTQASFLAGQSGQTRLQKTLEDAPEQAADHAAVPEVVVNDGPQPMPYPGHIVPDDTPLAELLPPPPLLRTPEPPTPSNPSAVTPAHMLPSFSPLPAGEGTSPLPMIVESGEGPGGDAPPQASTGTVRPPAEATEHVPPARKKLRLDAVQTDKDGQVMFHHDEEVTIEGDVAEEYLECADASDGVDYDDSADLPEVPECLLRPFSETEPYCTDAELQLIDDAADEFEFKRLMQLGVMTEVEGRLPEHRTLTTKSVRTWRPKVHKGEKVWLRRSRLVAREFAHIDPDRPGLFSPTTNQIMLRIVPALFLRCRERGWSLLALDVSDAFLQCSQHHATVTRIGDRWFKLWRMLPGQRDGSVTWFNDFTAEMQTAVGIELLPESPALFRLPDGAGGGYVHVDDMLCGGVTTILEKLEGHLQSKFKISSEWLREVGDHVTFLKRRHLLEHPDLLVIEPNVKYIDKLLEVTGLAQAKHRHKSTPFPTGVLPTEAGEDKDLDASTATRYRSAVGILMYMSSDLIACQFGIRYLSTYAHKPTEGAWKLLRHLTSYISSHRSHVVGLAKPELGRGLIRDRTSQPNTSVLEVCSDADWSGCKTTRKSVSSCAILWDNMLLYSHSKTQKVISLSSAESEYNSLVSAAAEGIFLAACIRFLIPEVELEVSCLVDNSAARSLACRQGVGKMRHISGKILWLQQCTRENVLTVGPIPTAENVSDIGTKPLKADRVDKLLGMLGIRCSNDGYALVGESHLLSWKERQRVCRVVKQGSLNMQQVMQVLAFVLQADRVTASTDEPNTSSNALSQEADDEDGTGYGMTIWNFLENLMYAIFLMCEFVTNHPYAIMLILQAFIVGAMCLQWCCSSRGGERSRSLQAQANEQPSVAVHVKVEGSTVTISNPEPAGAPSNPVDNMQPSTSASATTNRCNSAAAAKSAANDDHDARDPQEESSSSAMPTPKAVNVPRLRAVSEQNKMQQLVWVTRSRGKSFHVRRTCGTLGNAKALEQITRAEAIRKGFVPCKCCCVG